MLTISTAVCFRCRPEPSAAVLAVCILTAGRFKLMFQIRRLLILKLPRRLVPPAQRLTPAAIPSACSGQSVRQRFNRIANRGGRRTAYPQRFGKLVPWRHDGSFRAL